MTNDVKLSAAIADLALEDAWGTKNVKGKLPMVAHFSVVTLLFSILAAALACAPIEVRAEYAVLMHIANGRYLDAEKAGEESISTWCWPHHTQHRSTLLRLLQT